MAEKEKVCIDAGEYARLCRQDGKMDSLIAFMKHEDEEGSTPFSNRETIRAIIGVYE